ncbi:MAG: ABC transporter ATP-binding protein [Bdellovibrionaceae bacterium]|nr:ABC transporter ATP-binding protein [Pseudobdellovibrionaceae bacterium]
MIKVSEVSKSYGQRKAIDNMSFEVQEGEVVGFLGPNGAGKTTTMKMLTGFMAPTQGQILIDGVDVFEDPLRAKKVMGYLPETPPLYVDMSVKKYLAYVSDLKGVKKEDKTKNIEYVIEKLKLEDVKNRMIKNLSKGYRQRVGIAQALVSKPKILILDEPTVGLDPTQVAEFRNLINELRGEHTIILSTHILSEVQATCERVIIINKGKIVAENSIDGLAHMMTGAKNLVLRVRKNTPEFIKHLQALSYVRAVEAEGPRLKVQCDETETALEKLAIETIEFKAGLLEIREEEVQLEKIFIELTHKQEAQA